MIANVNTNDFMLMVEIGRNVTNIMNMPCVQEVHKNHQGKLVYGVFTEDNNLSYAMQGDFICQHHNGTWCVIRKDNSK